MGDRRYGIWMALVGLGCGLGCDDDQLLGARGILEIEVRNVRQGATVLRLEVDVDEGQVAQEIDVVRPSTFATFNELKVGSASAKAAALQPDGLPLDTVTVRGILIFTGQISRIVIDFALQDPPPPTPEEICNGIDDDQDGFIDEGLTVLCGICQADGSVIAAEDDPLCGEISCDALNTYRLEGDNTATGHSECELDRFGPLTDQRCAGTGACRMRNDATVCGPAVPELALEAGLCHTIGGCTERTPPTLVTVADGTPCGPMDVCMGGSCVPESTMMPADPTGCADGEREGFVDRMRYPRIAGCSGAWSVPGVRSTLAPACNRAAGDDGARTDGAGCSPADICSSGWHVCRDKEEVAASSPDGCAGAVPPGTPANGLLFITRQRSTNNIVCEDRATATGVNDLIGCGNLGTLLGAEKNCAPLDHALASQHDGACDFNEAEPPLGPWVCGASSIRESENVVKERSDLGGVLCCAN